MERSNAKEVIVGDIRVAPNERLQPTAMVGDAFTLDEREEIKKQPREREELHEPKVLEIFANFSEGENENFAQTEGVQR